MSPENHKRFGRCLSWPKRNILMDHVPVVSLPFPYGGPDRHRLQQVKWLMMKGLLERRGVVTLLTADGHAVVREILADYADSLSRLASPSLGHPFPRDWRQSIYGDEGALAGG